MSEAAVNEEVANVQMEQDKCQFILKKKKRQCRLTPMKDEMFCGEHILRCSSHGENSAQIEELEQKGRTGVKRVRCPLDPKHTVCEAKLAKHLKICNSRDPVELPYFNKGLNKIPSSDHVRDSETQLQESKEEGSFTGVPSAEDVSEVVEKIKLNFGLCSSDSLKDQFLQHPKVALDESERDLNTKKGKEASRHVTQIGSLLKRLELLGHFEQEGTVLLEMGAGRGQLSFWASLLKDKQLPILLVDNANVKNKFDHHYKYDAPSLYERINMSIEDLDLSQVEFLSKRFSTSPKSEADENRFKLVLVTKHLCGAATDFAITSAVNFHRLSGEPVPDMLLTFCCHHRCAWNSYVGKQFFLESGFSPGDFNVMSRISAWYTCGDKWHSEHTIEDLGEEKANEKSEATSKLNFVASEKKEIGKQCKYLINYGRLKYLEGLGMKCEMFNYVDSSVTLENVALLAQKL